MSSRTQPYLCFGTANDAFAGRVSLWPLDNSRLAGPARAIYRIVSLLLAHLYTLGKGEVGWDPETLRGIVSDIIPAIVRLRRLMDKHGDDIRRATSNKAGYDFHGSPWVFRRGSACEAAMQLVLECGDEALGAVLAFAAGDAKGEVLFDAYLIPFVLDDDWQRATDELRTHLSPCLKAINDCAVAAQWEMQNWTPCSKPALSREEIRGLVALHNVRVEDGRFAAVAPTSAVPAPPGLPEPEHHPQQDTPLTDTEMEMVKCAVAKGDAVTLVELIVASGLSPTGGYAKGLAGGLLKGGYFTKPSRGRYAPTDKAVRLCHGQAKRPDR